MKKTNKKDRRILTAALVVAGVTVAGSTFAWFTSKDEVTNRLSASADYNVSIAEDFQPTEDWVPGQTINKDVSAVNTGSVDAFVRMWLGGQMRVLNETSATDKVDAKTSLAIGGTGLQPVTDKDKLAVGLTWYKDNSGTIQYYRTLSKEKTDNPKDSNHASTGSEETNAPAQFSEVQSVQAGGVLVYAPANAKYHWTLEQATELPVYEAANPVAGVMTNIAKDTVVGNSTSTVATTKLAQASTSDTNYYGAIDASTFQPESEGLYIFRRNIIETDDGTENTYEYSGYYYVPANGTRLEQYFALHTGAGDNGHSDYVLPSGSVTENNSALPSSGQVLPVTVAADKVYLYTATEQVLDTDDLTWTYTAGTKFTVTYNNGTTDDTTDDIAIDINLANIGTASEEWTAIPDTTDPYKTTFYYNNDVEAGDTTTKLVDSVTLSGDTTNGAYLAFDFDLDVFLESVQVTIDEDGKELCKPVNTWAATTGANNTGAQPSEGDEAKTYTGNYEISVVGWEAIS